MLGLYTYGLECINLLPDKSHGAHQHHSFNKQDVNFTDNNCVPSNIEGSVRFLRADDTFQTWLPRSRGNECARVMGGKAWQLTGTETDKNTGFTGPCVELFKKTWGGEIWNFQREKIEGGKGKRYMKAFVGSFPYKNLHRVGYSILWDLTSAKSWYQKSPKKHNWTVVWKKNDCQ